MVHSLTSNWITDLGEMEKRISQRSLVEVSLHTSTRSYGTLILESVYYGTQWNRYLIVSLVRVSLHKQLHNYAFIPGTINLSVSTFSRFPNVTNSTFSFIVHSHMHRTLSLFSLYSRTLASSYGFNSFLSTIYLLGSSSYTIVSTEQHLNIYL